MRCLLYLSVTLLVACSEPPESPQAQIEALVARGEQAAKEKDLAFFRDVLSEDFTSHHGHDKRAAERLLRWYFFRHKKLYLLSRIQSIELVQADEALLEISVVVAGTPLPEDLSGLRADAQRFKIRLTRDDGDWQVRYADWQRAALSDFL